MSQHNLNLSPKRQKYRLKFGNKALNLEFKFQFYLGTGTGMSQQNLSINPHRTQKASQMETCQFEGRFI